LRRAPFHRCRGDRFLRLATSIQVASYGGKKESQVKKLVPLCAVVAVAVTCGRSGVYRFDTVSSVPDAAVPELDAGTDAGELDAGPVPCIPGHITLVKATPVVMLVLDRSRSMSTRFDGPTSRWQALIDGLAMSLPVVDQTMQLGALIFPMGDGAFACIASLSVDFQPQKGNVDGILGKMRSLTPVGSTPTALAVDIAGDAVQLVRATKQGRALVLATDGAPDCNSSLDPTTCACVSNSGVTTGRCDPIRCLDDAHTVGEIAHFTDAGIPTYVIGIQSESDTTLVGVLNDMAKAGGRPQQNAATSYYAVSSRAQLDAALVAIRDQVGACVYLARSVPDRDEAMTVMLEGFGLVPYDPTGKSGWTWSDKTNGELVINGPACAAVISHASAAVLDAVVACGK
jgi:hypothetical protein